MVDAYSILDSISQGSQNSTDFSMQRAAARKAAALAKQQQDAQNIQQAAYDGMQQRASAGLAADRANFQTQLTNQQTQFQNTYATQQTQLSAAQKAYETKLGAQQTALTKQMQLAATAQQKSMVASQLGQTVTAGSPTPAKSPGYMPPAAPVQNKFATVSIGNAANQVRNPSQDWTNKCLKFVRTTLGIPGGEPTAIAAWKDASVKFTATPIPQIPPGVPVYWAPGGGNPAGHIALSAGNGMCYSTDINRKGQVDLVPIAEITKRWNKPFLGWTPSLNGHAIAGARA